MIKHYNITVGIKYYLRDLLFDINNYAFEAYCYFVGQDLQSSNMLQIR